MFAQVDSHPEVGQERATGLLHRHMTIRITWQTEPSHSPKSTNSELVAYLQQGV